jgi:hypothetical protein
VSLPAASPPTLPSGSARIRVPRWFAANALLVGGALAFIASFLPLGQTTDLASGGSPASTSFWIPAQELVTVVGFNAQAPDEGIVGTSLWAFTLWGAPVMLAALGGTLLLARRWTPAARVRVVGVILVAVGAGFTVLSCWGYLNPFFGSQGATRTLEYGPGVALLGYLCAQAGTIWLPVLPRRSRR